MRLALGAKSQPRKPETIGGRLGGSGSLTDPDGSRPACQLYLGAGALAFSDNQWCWELDGIILWAGDGVARGLSLVPIVDRLNAEVRKALAVPDVKSKLEAMGGDARATTPDEMKALVSRQYETWKKLAVEANLSIN